MPRRPFLIEGYDSLWALDLASLAGTRSASSEFFHFIRNMSSPLESVAPIILSGSKPRAKLRGFSDSSFFFFGLFSSPLSSESESALRLPPSDLSVSCAVFCDCRNSAMRSGQSGSLLDPVCYPHLRTPSTLGDTPLWPLPLNGLELFPPHILLPLLLAPPPLSSCFVFSP